MLTYTINENNLKTTKTFLSVNSMDTLDFEDWLNDSEISNFNYGGGSHDKQKLITCHCDDIDKIKEGDSISAVNTLYLNYSINGTMSQMSYDFLRNYEVCGVNKTENSFSFYVNKYLPLDVESITSGFDYLFPDYYVGPVRDNILIHTKGQHYFDTFDHLTHVTLTREEDNIVEDEAVVDKQLIPIYFRYTNNEGKLKETILYFRYYDSTTLSSSYTDIKNDDQKTLYNIIFGTDVEDDLYSERKEGNLGGIEVLRENFAFTDKTFYTFYYERPYVEFKIPFTNTFDNDLYHQYLIQEQFVDKARRDSINPIIDLEKDVYYPVISKGENDSFTHVTTIKFNLHFREHRGDDWLVDKASFWNGVSDGQIDRRITDDDVSDLLTFLSFTNNDVRYQKNKLKKSFLRLSFYDSTNPGNQNLLSYSTVFFDTGDMFAKYAKYMEKDGYHNIGADKETFGIYDYNETNKIGIKVDREYKEKKDSTYKKYDDKRLSSQIVIKDKDISRASSEGFYLYLWKDNESEMPQDLYMKVEFNHAEFGRIVPFMLPYWDKEKWNDSKKGIKTFQEIMNDWNDIKKEDGSWHDTDGHYGMRQYNKFSYIHLKYQYDKENDKHIYYLDPDTYDKDAQKGEDEIIINLYEAKVE